MVKIESLSNNLTTLAFAGFKDRMRDMDLMDDRGRLYAEFWYK
jgi:hypothetical protein